MKAIILTKSLGAGASEFSKGVRSIIGEGKVVNNFTPAEKASLGEDVVNFIKSLQKDNPLKPLDEDTVYFSTHEIPGFRAYDGTVVKPERVLHIELPYNKHGHLGLPLVLEDGTRYSEPLTVDGIKNAIRELMLGRKREIAVCNYSKNPTEENKQAALALFPKELKEDTEFILRSALDHERYKML